MGDIYIPKRCNLQFMHSLFLSLSGSFEDMGILHVFHFYKAKAQFSRLNLRKWRVHFKGALTNSGPVRSGYFIFIFFCSIGCISGLSNLYRILILVNVCFSQYSWSSKLIKNKNDSYILTYSNNWIIKNDFFNSSSDQFFLMRD